VYSQGVRVVWLLAFAMAGAGSVAQRAARLGVSGGWLAWPCAARQRGTQSAVYAYALLCAAGAAKVCAALLCFSRGRQRFAKSLLH
jgi:hypothetical protein